MNLTYFDTVVSQKQVETEQKKLADYRQQVAKVVEQANTKKPEYSLALWKDDAALERVYEVATHFKKVKHVVVVGIGGSSLGTEAIHSVLASDASPKLHVLDTVSAFELEQVLKQLSSVRKAEHIAVCVVSKSGTTTETLANASVLLNTLATQVGKQIYKQTVFIGDKKSQLVKVSKKLGSSYVAMPAVVGGRFSVFTPAGLVPLALLGHDIEALLSGLQDATSEPYERSVAESAARLHLYLKKKFDTVNLFTFDTRLVRLGKWYRQLAAESLGKEHVKGRKKLTYGFVPTTVTPVELHSIGQLYFSGSQAVYTNFLSFDDEEYDFEISKKSEIAAKLKGKSFQEIHTAMYGGVIGAYQKRELPYQATLLEGDLNYSLGLFMGMKMLETMYLAELMGVNAFNQPNVELYKDITRKILKV